MVCLMRVGQLDCRGRKQIMKGTNCMYVIFPHLALSASNHSILLCGLFGDGFLD